LNEAELGAEEEPLNSEDDVTDEDAADLFETDNVVVCQYDKVIKGLINYLTDSVMEHQSIYSFLI
jgi:transcription initiation factor TFIIA large subunit